MQYRWSHVAEPGQAHWLIKRNCALSPRQLGCCFGALAALTLSISGLFALQGAWLLLPFAGLEAAALGLAYLVYARHAADYDRIEVDRERVLVERASGGRTARVEWRSGWVRVAYGGGRREPIRLIAAGSEVAVGRFVPDGSKEQLVRELRASLAQWRA